MAKYKIPIRPTQVKDVFTDHGTLLFTTIKRRLIDKGMDKDVVEKEANRLISVGAIVKEGMIGTVQGYKVENWDAEIKM